MTGPDNGQITELEFGVDGIVIEVAGNRLVLPRHSIATFNRSTDELLWHGATASGVPWMARAEFSTERIPKRDLDRLEAWLLGRGLRGCTRCGKLGHYAKTCDEPEPPQDLALEVVDP